jgi:hypothetical protein
MSDLINEAETFATQAHARIDHRRRYSQQPYDVHLRAVAKLVGEVTDDADVIAAAWLHDTVEDTPCTFADIEAKFGPRIARLVAELTDVSRPSDGNRAQRKAQDRDHLAGASPQAKTIKLADLIDNCRDICKHDPRFARVFIAEAHALLAVLGEGDSTLLGRARRSIARCAERLALPLPDATAPQELAENAAKTALVDGSAKRLRRVFLEAFRAEDISESLLSFDAESAAAHAATTLATHNLGVAGIRIDGRMRGYARCEELREGRCADHLRNFAAAQQVDANTPFADVIHVLTFYEYCFVRSFGEVAGVITRSDIQKPEVRMWLFGIITMTEMRLTDDIHRTWPGGEWVRLLSPGRLGKAEALRAERQQRGHHCELLDCLQLADKAQLLMEIPDQLQAYGFKSKAAAKQVAKELESLRNHLAHAQDIVTHNWAQIARMSQRLARIAQQ